MDKLLSHLIQQHVTRDPSPLLHSLCTLHQITFKSTAKTSQDDLQLIHYLLQKKIVSYHPSLLTLTLNIPAVLFYQRVYKLRRFCRNFTTPLFTQLFQRFCQNQLMPLGVTTQELKKVAPKGNHEVHQKGEGHSRKKQVAESKETNKDHHLIDYQRLVYEYKEKEEGRKEGEVEIMINVEEITELYRYHLIIRQLSKEQREQLRQALKIKENVKPESMFIDVFNAAKENTPNSEVFKQFSLKVREQKVEEYILQSFRKHGENEQTKQQLARNVLLIYNLVKLYPLIGEKQLLKMSLLEIVQQRKCLNLLVSEGILNYFPENIKSVLYKAIPQEQIETIVRNAIAVAILNLQVVIGERRVSKEQLLKMEAMIEQLDDSLLLLAE